MIITKKYNINDMVTVTLTEKGLEHLASSRAAVNGYPPGLTGGRVYKTELWHLMQTFGPKTYMGGPQYFVDNNIRIEEYTDDKKLPSNKKEETTAQSLAIEICRKEFIESLFDAMSQAGGKFGSPETIGKTTVEELKNVLAQNGIRFWYQPNGTVSKVDSRRILEIALEKLNK
jgi:hypothetical protein